MDSLCVENYRRILEKNEKTIKGSINLSCLLPKLRTKGLLTDDEYQLLLEIVTSHPYETHNSSQRLFQILLTKGGGNALNLFIEALQEENEHLGHKTLAIALLGEVSSVKPKLATKRPPPAVPARTKTLTRTNQNQDPQPFSTPQSVRKQPLLPPSQRSRAVTMSDTEVAKEKALFGKNTPKVFIDVQDSVQADPQQHLFDRTCISKFTQVNTKLDSLQHSIQIVHQLSTVIVDMKEKMESMEQLLHSLLDNQQPDKDEYDIGPKRHVLKEANHRRENHDYIDDPVNNNANNPPTNTKSDEVHAYDYVRLGTITTAVSEYTSLTKKPVERLYENSPLQKFNQADYVESRLLAHGYSGEYWLAVSKISGSKVVVKRPAATISKEKLDQEVNALTKCKHPNVIQFIIADINTTEQVYLLYFEYAERGPLKSYLRSETTNISLAKLLAMAANIACGMAELEKQKVIHCDLKASNILIDGDYLCKIASFNKAQCLKGNEKHKVCDLYHLATRWLAPEVLNNRKFSTKSDVWSFGVLMAELLSYGSKPYPTMKSDEVKKFVLGKKKMPRPSGCPDDIYDIMKGCFQHREDQRLPFTEIYKQLTEFQSKLFKKSSSDSSITSSEYED